NLSGDCARQAQKAMGTSSTAQTRGLAWKIETSETHARITLAKTTRANRDLKSLKGRVERIDVTVKIGDAQYRGFAINPNTFRSSVRLRAVRKFNLWISTFAGKLEPDVVNFPTLCPVSTPFPGCFP